MLGRVRGRSNMSAHSGTILPLTENRGLFNQQQHHTRVTFSYLLKKRVNQQHFAIISPLQPSPIPNAMKKFDYALLASVD